MKTSLLPLLAAITFGALAAGCASSEKPPVAAHVSASRTISVVVDGMVCNFCVTNIDKTLAKLPGVSAVYVDLSAGVVLLGVNNPELPADADIRRAVVDAGYDVSSIRRTDRPFAESRDAMKAEALKNR